MKLASFFSVTVLAALVSAAATSDEDVVMVTSEFFPEELAVYTSHHDIIGLTVPVNGINSEQLKIKNENDDDISVFITEADVKVWKKLFRGVSLLKGDKVTNILKTGTDSAADKTDSKDVYISATDGLYVYKGKVGKVGRYGSITDNLISVVKLNSSDTLYVLTADYVVYKVTANGENKVKVDELSGARQIVLDNSDNLYYYGDDKQPYVRTKDGFKKIEGLPANPTSVALIKPTFILDEGVAFVSDDKIYYLKPSGSSRWGHFILEAKPTAYAMEGTSIQYYAYNKKIYNFDFKKVLKLLSSTKYFNKEQ